MLQHSGSESDEVAFNCLDSETWDVLAAKREWRSCWQPSDRPPPT